MLFKRHISFFVIFVLALTLFAGCGEKDNDSKPSASTDTTTDISSSQPSEPDEPSEPSSSDTSTSSDDASSDNQTSSSAPSSSQSSEPHLHAYKITRIAPTCTSEGHILYECSCGDKKQEVVPAKGHSWSEWNITSNPTFTELGKKERRCTVCGVSESKDIETLSEDDFINEMVKLVNEQRKAESLKEIVYRDDIQACTDILLNELMENPEGINPDDFDYSALFGSHGIAYKFAGANLAIGSPDASTVMQNWMDSTSSESRNNILSKDFTGIAVGIAEKDGMYYWVQLFIG